MNDKLSVPFDKDHSEQPEYLPFSSVNIHDTTQKEDEDIENQPIPTVTGNRYYPCIENSNLTQSYSHTEGWEEDCFLPEGWNTRSEDWSKRPNIPHGRSVKKNTNNITVKKDNRAILASKLPAIFVTNHRSFFPKFRNFVEVMQTLGLTLGLHSEIWEDREKKDHMDKIEEALEIEGIQYISNTRPNRRGGGAAITLICGDFYLTKLDVLVPKNLEVAWGLVRPNKQTKNFKGIIACSFYSVPNSKQKTQLL